MCTLTAIRRGRGREGAGQIASLRDESRKDKMPKESERSASFPATKEHSSHEASSHL